MCIGIPMQVIAVEEGFAQVQGRGEFRRIKTALIGDCAVGDWLLTFIDDAREIISAERALEVNATLDLLQAVMDGGLSAGVIDIQHQHRGPRLGQARGAGPTDAGGEGRMGPYRRSRWRPLKATRGLHDQMQATAG